MFLKVSPCYTFIFQRPRGITESCVDMSGYLSPAFNKLGRKSAVSSQQKTEEKKQNKQKENERATAESCHLAPFWLATQSELIRRWKTNESCRPIMILSNLRTTRVIMIIRHIWHCLFSLTVVTEASRKLFVNLYIALVSSQA